MIHSILSYMNPRVVPFSPSLQFYHLHFLSNSSKLINLLKFIHSQAVQFCLKH
uniref:Uncharacterized protein n=1 Tax=Rhizophora mucronata TaxID=61149 RepID=A0A2P2QQG8_RHIMU